MPGVGYSSSEKQRPGPLDLCLLFREVVDVKRASGAGASIRELLFSSIAEYNRSVSTKVGGHSDVQFPWISITVTPQTMNDLLLLRQGRIWLISYPKSGIPGEWIYATTHVRNPAVPCLLPGDLEVCYRSLCLEGLRLVVFFSKSMQNSTHYHVKCLMLFFRYTMFCTWYLVESCILSLVSKEEIWTCSPKYNRFMILPGDTISSNQSFHKDWPHVPLFPLVKP